MKIWQEAISEHIWQQKYRYRDATDGEAHITATWQRVANGVARAEPRANGKQIAQQFNELLTDFKFLPGGRILAGANTKYKVTLYNCFVMGAIPDSLPGIFKSLQESAQTLQQGGGVGCDFSTLRPSGELTTQTNAIASGPVSFMHIWNSMSATMQSTGARRGAMMATLRVDHPDIENFIDAKATAKTLEHFNVSVLITDDFMQAVKNNAAWPLVFPVTDKASLNSLPKSQIVNKAWPGFDGKVACRIYRAIPAKKLWYKIIKAAYDYAEPGVIFIDTINNSNALSYCETIHATNPCGEIPLPYYGACNLGSINLVKFVKNAFTKQAAIDWQGLEQTAKLATHFLDNVIDVSHYPLAKQKQAAQATRRLGLGVTGLANLFVMMGCKYGDKKSLQLTRQIMQTIRDSSIIKSCELAAEKGCFPLYDKTKFCRTDYFKSLPKQLQQLIRKYGLRNSHHTAIAPTGTISLLANNVSSGIEPIFAKQYQRQVRDADSKLITYDVQDYAYKLWQASIKSSDAELELPKAWIDAQELTPKKHLAILEALQPYIDNAMSKTIFIPEDFSFTKVANVYSEAYSKGLKGCTIFRPNPTRGNVLTTESVSGQGSHCAACYTE